MLMKTPNALRIERHRRRKREGKMLVLGTEMNIHTVAEKLIEHGLLPWDKAEDRAAITDAISCLLFDLFEKDLEDG